MPFRKKSVEIYTGKLGYRQHFKCTKVYRVYRGTDNFLQTFSYCTEGQTISYRHFPTGLNPVSDKATEFDSGDERNPSERFKSIFLWMNFARIWFTAASARNTGRQLRSEMDAPFPTAGCPGG